MRVYVILRSVFKHGLKSIGVKVLLLLGFILIFAFQIIAVVLSPHEGLEAYEMNANMNASALAIFAMLLAAVVTSDLISEDLSNNSFVLYFSRALKTRDYLMGKAGGALLIMSILCIIPPLLIAIVATATQSGDDYWGSLGVVGRTAIAGTLATAFFVPYGLMLSSFTRKRSYAAVGTFMSFFVLTIIASVFSEFADEWIVISPVDSFMYSFDWIFGQALPSYVDKGALAAFLALFMVLPAAVVYIRTMRQAVGK
jgi:ABC-type transport system involved in multi-copper enzyme maturation permease subunit